MNKFNDRYESYMNEGKSSKVYYLQNNIGKSKYVLNFHDGEKTHEDGSPFYDVATFKNLKLLANKIVELEKKGYKEK